MVGAGMAGLTAAGRIARAGHEVTVVDKGRRAGGRLATQDLADGGRADHGAQFFTTRSDAFGEQVGQWATEGTAHVWCRGFTSEDGHPRYAVGGGMRRLGARLADGLDVQTSTRVTSIVPSGAGWSVSWPDGPHSTAGRIVADMVVVTAPVPQAAALLFDHVDVPDITYTPVLALTVALGAQPAIPAPGGVQLDDDPTWTWVADNRAKGVSPSPAVTFHTRSDVATARWDDAAEVVTADLLGAAAPWLGDAEVVDVALHRWRYAAPTECHPEPCWVAPDGRIVLAGDAFGSPRVEGAFLSGLAAAAHVIGQR